MNAITGLGVLGKALGFKLQKLTIEQITKTTKEAPKSVTVMYNPEALSFHIEAKYEPLTGVESTSEFQVFDHLKYGDLTLDLILDASRPGARESVTSQLTQLRNVCMPVSDDNKKYVAPKLKISWGRMDWFGAHFCTAVATEMSVHYTLFDRSGRPMRATVALALKVKPGKTSGNNKSTSVSGKAKPKINNLRDKLGI